MNYKNICVWVTGGGSGIGAALARRYWKLGASVAISGRRLGKLEEVIAEEKVEAERALAIECDVRSFDSVEKAVGEIQSKWGRLDVSVANAGFAVTGKFEAVELEQWKGQFETNVLGVVHTLRASIPLVEESKGRLAVISSVMGLAPAYRCAPYCASKHALTGLCRSLQLELKGRPISLTNIMPGFVESEIRNVDNNGELRAEPTARAPSRLVWRADDAAKVMVKAIDARKREAVVTGHGKVAGWIGRHIPDLVYWVQR